MTNTYGSSLEGLMGDDVILFNKDMDTEDSYSQRQTSLDHVDDCDCLDCENERLHDNE